MLYRRLTAIAASLCLSTSLTTPAPAQDNARPSTFQDVAISVLPLALLTAGTIAVMSASSPARAQGMTDAPTFQDTLDQLSVLSTQIGLFGVRLFADLEYGSVDALPGTGGVLVSDVTVAIPVPYAAPRECTVTIGSYEGRQSTLALLTGLLGSQSARLADVRVPLACLPPPARTTVQIAGLTEIAVDELRISTTYDVPTAQADVALDLSVRDVADVQLRGMLDYAFVRLNFEGMGEEDPTDPFGGTKDEPTPEPSIEFGPIDLVLTDRGLSERAVPFLTLVGLTTEQIPAIAGDGVRSALGPLPLADDLERELSRFLTEGGRLAIALRPGDLWLDELEDATPPEIVAAFNPSIGARPIYETVSPELLIALRDDALSDEQRLEAARAFTSGDGLPRNPQRAVAVLEPLVENGPAAQELAAEAHLAMGEANEAYRLALRAGEADRDVETLLRLAESELSAQDVAAAQERALDEQIDAFRLNGAIENADTAGILAIARDHERGVGAVRSYPRALSLALLADAAGEVGARPMVERLEARMTANAEARAAWSDALAGAREEATERWLQGGLAARLAARIEFERSSAAPATSAVDEGSDEPEIELAPLPEAPTAPPAIDGAPATE